MELELKHTPVYTWNNEALEDKDVRFIVNQGGSRSSKTYSICQLLIVTAMSKPKTKISIVRKSMPSMRKSVMNDFFEIMHELNIYKEDCHHKGSDSYEFPNGSVIEFFSLDDSQKVRGTKRSILYCNEANEIGSEAFFQLNMRTTDKIFLDYNPSDNYSWVYDILARTNAKLIKSTYRDNPFCPQAFIDEINETRLLNPEYYEIYGEGNQAILKDTIYSHYTSGGWKAGNDTFYGLDIGYNHPMALVEITDVDGVIHARELIYESSMTPTDLMKRIADLGISKSKDIIVDSARPDIIEDLRRLGYNAKLADKAVKLGIDAVKTLPLVIDSTSENMLKEIRNYKWKKNGEIVLDEPIKIWDDAMDALRYVMYFYYKKYVKKRGRVVFMGGTPRIPE